MNADLEQSEPQPPSGGFSSSVRRIVLLVAGLAILAGGTAVGIVIEKAQSESSASDDSVAGSAVEAEATLPQGIPDLFSEPLTESPAADVSSAVEPKLTSSQRPSAPVNPNSDDSRIAKVAAENPALALIQPVEDIPGRMKHVNLLMREGHFSAALEILQTLANEPQSGIKSEIYLHKALCLEAIGNANDALADYRRVIAISTNRFEFEAALLGQTRIWYKTGRSELATSSLYRTLLEVPSSFSDRDQNQIPHRLATYLSGQLSNSTKSGELSSLQDDLLPIPMDILHPEQLLDEWSKRRTAHDANTDDPIPEGVSVTHRFSSLPDEIFLSLRTERLSALELLYRITQATGWNVDLSESARDRLQEHTLDPECSDLSLALILDALLDQYQLVWRVSGEKLVVSDRSELSTGDVFRFRLDAARRTLRFACTSAPQQAGAAASFMELGRIAAMEGNLEAAIHHYQQSIDLFPQSEHVSQAWFNLGKLSLRMGNRQQALDEFLRAADIMTGHPLEPAAYLYVGRIHLENDAARQAVMPLTRGLALSEGTEYEPIMAMMLSSAFYMLENLRGANDVLMTHRESLDVPGVRDQAAFLASMIRYQATHEERYRTREGATLIRALTNLELKDLFGGHWWYFVGMAYRETGLVSEALAVFSDCVNRMQPFPLQSRMRSLMLAERSGTALPVSDAQSAMPGSPSSFESLMKVATESFHGEQYEQTLVSCRKLMEMPEVPEEIRRQALGLMGRVYQLRGEHHQAIVCFTGVLPETEDVSDPVRSPLESGAP